MKIKLIKPRCDECGTQEKVMKTKVAIMHGMEPEEYFFCSQTCMAHFQWKVIHHQEVPVA